MILKMLIGVLFAVGVYFILADIYRLPTIKTSRAISNLAKAQRDKTSSIDIWLGNFAGFIAKHLPMNEFRRQELEIDLRTAQMDITPEMYIANAIVKALLIAVFAIPVYFILPILSPLILFLAVVLYKMNTKTVSSKIKVKRSKIENDLPRLVSTVEKKISYDRNILGILEEFLPYAGAELHHELTTTIADLHSSNEESAITKLESRVGSTMMSDVCRGFIALIHGDASPVYWASLKMKFADIQRNRLKAEAEKIPRKVKRLSMCLLFCFLLIYIVVIIAQIMNSMGVLFA